MSFFKHSYVAGVSLALPRRRLHLADLNFGERYITRTSHLTGIEDVCLAEPGQTVSDYAVQAAKYMFSEMEVDCSTIDSVVFVSGYPDYPQPCTAGIIQEKLGLRLNMPVFDINHLCSGFIYGIYQASLLIESGACHNVLLCMGDFSASTTIHPKDKSARMVAGDSACAVLISRAEDMEFPEEFSFYHDGSRARKLGLFVGGTRYPHRPGVTDVEKEDENGNIRTDENFYMDGMEIMRFAMTEVQPRVEEVLQKCGWKKDAVDVIGFHQANEFIVKSLIRQMKLPKEKTPIAVRHTGNLGCDSIPIALFQQSKVVDSSEWKKCVLCGFGGGLSSAAVGLDLHRTRFLEPVIV
jgi:3-oxoacyl-[acyl-carrier-protein] synthase III